MANDPCTQGNLRCELGTSLACSFSLALAFNQIEPAPRVRFYVKRVPCSARAKMHTCVDVYKLNVRGSVNLMRRPPRSFGLRP